MFLTCKLCDLPCKESAIPRHMNRAHHNFSSAELNDAELANRTPTDTYCHNRWVDCPSCYSITGTHHHFLGLRGLKQHESRSHQPNIRTLQYFHVTHFRDFQRHCKFYVFFGFTKFYIHKKISNIRPILLSY